MTWQSVEPYAPFALLAGALLVFLLSTRQWALGLRALTWAVGATLLIGAGWMALRDQNPGVFGLAADALRGNPLNSALAETLTGNAHRVTAQLASMFSIMLLISAGLALVALLAFSNGERLEHILRPLLYVSLGAIGGGFLALTMVALGFGGYQKDRTYAARASDIAVIDGDTIRMGDVTLRLWGIDAPERDQVCLKDRYCARKATDHLKGLIKDTFVVCGPPMDLERPRETFGRPMVSCRAYGSRMFDIAERMAKDGYADVYRNNEHMIVSTYCTEVKAAQGRGLWPSGMLQPSQWRNDDDARVKFVDERELPRIDVVLDECAKNATTRLK